MVKLELAIFLFGLAAQPIGLSVALVGLLLVAKVCEGAAWPKGSYKYTELLGVPSALVVMAAGWSCLTCYPAEVVVGHGGDIAECVCGVNCPAQ